jgi:hypothetical protein
MNESRTQPRTHRGFFMQQKSPQRGMRAGLIGMSHRNGCFPSVITSILEKAEDCLVLGRLLTAATSLVAVSVRIGRRRVVNVGTFKEAVHESL